MKECAHAETLGVLHSKATTPVDSPSHEARLQSLAPKLTPNRLTLRPLHTWDWEPMTIALQALSLVEKVEPVQARFTLRLRDQQSTWMQDGRKPYMDSYVASNGSCSMAAWILFKNHLSEVDLTWNHRETMALRTLTTVDSFYSIMREHPYE